MLLTLGVVCNLAVAWLLASFGRVTSGAGGFNGPHGPWLAPARREGRPDYSYNGSGPGIRWREVSYTGLADWPTALVFTTAAEFGWPVCSLRWRRSEVVELGSAVRYYRGLPIPGRLGPASGLRAGVGRALPLEPVWPGFAFNTAAWGGLCALLWLGRDRWLASGRRAHGLCRSCGYDLTGLAAGAVCPECGAPGPKSPLPTAAATSAGSATGTGGE